MPLNYSKWEKLEVSDDSDIEGHPNVDHKSLVRWKQRDIHEKREQRKTNIAHLTAQLEMHEVILPRLKSLHDTLTSSPPSKIPSVFNAVFEKLEKDPSPDRHPQTDPSLPEMTYDGMILSLLRQVIAASRDKISANASLAAEEKVERMGKELIEGVNVHIEKVTELIERDRKELEKELAEQKKKITSDDLHEGFSSTYHAPPPQPGPVPKKKPKTTTQTTTEIEVLNAPTPTTDPPPYSLFPEDDEGVLPELTPALEGFAKLPLFDFEESFRYIQNNRDVVVEGAEDALLVAAFTAQGAGDPKFAKQCVAQSISLQYCSKMGRDGVGIFYKRMIGGLPEALKIYHDDVEKTYAHLAKRVKVTQEEAAAGGREQIQLVPENPSQTISFNIPDGPPPENIVLEGEGTEDLDIEEVKRHLQAKWEVFEAFPVAMKDALKKGDLAGVNEVLCDMDIEEAEGLVGLLDKTGMLNFAEGGVRDQTRIRQGDE